MLSPYLCRDLNIRFGFDIASKICHFNQHCTTDLDLVHKFELHSAMVDFLLLHIIYAERHSEEWLFRKTSFVAPHLLNNRSQVHQPLSHSSNYRSNFIVCTFIDSHQYAQSLMYLMEFIDLLFDDTQIRLLTPNQLLRVIKRMMRSLCLRTKNLRLTIMSSRWRNVAHHPQWPNKNLSTTRNRILP